MTERTIRARLLSPAVIVAALSALSYLAAYAFERGYADFFRIPPQLIVVSLGSTLRAVLTLAFGAIVVMLYLNPVVALFGKLLEHRDLAIRLIPIWPLVLIVFTALASLAYGFNWVLAVIVIVSVILYGMVLLALWAILHAPRKAAEGRDEVQADTPKERPKGLYARVFELVGPAWYFGTLAIMLVLGAAFLAGRASARQQRIFDISDKGYALIREYGDLILLEKVDLKRHEVLNALEARTTKEMNNMHFSRVRIAGDLTVEMPRLVGAPSSKPRTKAEKVLRATHEAPKQSQEKRQATK